MRQKKTKQMLDYWMQLFRDAGNEQIDNLQSDFGIAWPERSDIQPANCRSLLGNMFILERETPTSQIRYRLAGTNLCSVYGRELKRETYTRAFAESEQQAASNWITRLGLDEYLVLICSNAETVRQDRINLETLLMPLNHHGERGKRILGITTASDQPYWLGIRPLITQTIQSARVLRPWESNGSRHEIIGKNISSPNFKEQRQSLQAPQLFDELKNTENNGMHDDKSPRRVGHLTVIDGGRT